MRFLKYSVLALATFSVSSPAIAQGNFSKKFDGFVTPTAGNGGAAQNLENMAFTAATSEPAPQYAAPYNTPAQPKAANAPQVQVMTNFDRYPAVQAAVQNAQAVQAAPQQTPAPAQIASAAADTAQSGYQVLGYKWSGRIDASGEVLDGNSNEKSFGIDGKAKARDEKNRFQFGGEINWAESEGQETENDRMIFGEYDRFISKKMFYGVRAQFETDKVAKLDLRSEIGPYAGYQFYESDEINLSTRLGLEYINEEFENAGSEDNIALAWGLDYDKRLWDNILQYYYEHDFSMPIDETDAYLLSIETGLRFPVAKVLSGTFAIDYDYDNAPAPGVEKDDTKYALKLGYEF